ALLGLGRARNQAGAAAPGAIQPREQALRLGQGIPSRRIQIRVLHALGQAYLAGTQPEQARRMLTRAASMARELGLDEQAAAIQRTLAAERAGDRGDTS
ncbi:MAG: hypothetical protein HOY71_25540, partial [Nonomuraea sp.]|nr:hypothetical protein [Nonomuraea sp.]